MPIQIIKKRSEAEEFLDDLVDETEAAAILGLKPRSMRVLRSRGRGPAFIRLHRKVYFRKTVLADYVRRHEVQPALGS